MIPKGFFPQQDTGAITGGMQGPQDASFPAMNDSIQQIVGVIRNDPAVANVIAFTGGGGATNTGFIYIALKPLAQRKVNVAQVIGRLRPKLNRLPAAAAFSAGGAGSAHRWPRRQCDVSVQPCRRIIHRICTSGARSCCAR